MIKVLSCLSGQHDLRFVLVAGVVCLLSTVTAFSMHTRTVVARGWARAGWLGLTGAAAGGGIWATHFIAMVAFDPAMPTRFETIGTVVSLLIAVAVAAGGFALASWRRLPGQCRWLLGGPTLGAGIGLMHYTGMTAFRTQGLVLWDGAYVTASLAIGVALATAAVWIGGRASGLRQRLSGAILLTLGICGLHFTAMAAMTIVPDPQVLLPDNALSHTAMAVVVAILALGLMAAAAFMATLDGRVRRKTLSTLEAAFNAMPEAVAYFDRDGRCLLWNRRYAELAPPGVIGPDGFSMRELAEAVARQGLVEEAIGREADWVAARLERFRNPGEPIEHRRPDGRWTRVAERATADGGVITVLSDVTELKARAEIMEQARLAAEAASRAKSEFLANMSHEIRTPLNGVVAMADLLARRDLPDDVLAMVETIKESGSALAGLVSDILDLARVEAGKMVWDRKSFALGEVVRSTAALSRAEAQAKNLELSVEIAEAADGGFIGDPLRVRQIVGNLISNAVKFTECGRVTVRADRIGASLVRIEVEDTGCGFHPRDKAKIFNRFEQLDGSIDRHHGGSGLGLALVKEMAELAGGGIDCESTPGAGSRFWCVLPLEPAPLAAEPAMSPVTCGEDLRVLVVDDHPNNRKVAAMMLSACEARVTEAENGEQALAACRPGRFDLILMDMQMPVMDGLTATREIRRLDAETGLHTPIIMLTANAMPEHVQAALAAGADLHVSKPVTSEKLFKAIEAALGGREAAAAA